MRQRRPYLDPLPLDEAMAAATGQRGGVVVVTMSTGQWDPILAAFYSQGWTLLELDADERPVRAYRQRRPS